MAIRIQLIFINGNERQGLHEMTFWSVLHTSNRASFQKAYFMFFEPRTVIHLCDKNQQNVHFLQ